MKAILVIDMPEACGPCRFSTRGTHPFCIATDRTHLVDISKGDRPSWCPLKEMPSKMGKLFLTEETQKDTKLIFKAAYTNSYTDGWNACIEEIER